MPKTEKKKEKKNPVFIHNMSDKNYSRLTKLATDKKRSMAAQAEVLIEKALDKNLDA
jgi:hypothetical protein